LETFNKGEMIEYLMLVLLALWSIALFTGNYFDGFVHLLLIGVFVSFGIRYFTGKEVI
jgi:Family of unknown function (DUF5670)